ncbi:MAG: hypothetical protein AB7F86_00570 [Bdellovibrionales bacterium]
MRTVNKFKALNPDSAKVILGIMEKGFNSDVSVLGTVYHVQTEDWGINNPYLVSRVFRNGAVVKSIKTSYTEVLPESPAVGSTAIRLAMKIQHQQILDLLVSGKLL